MKGDLVDDYYTRQERNAVMTKPTDRHMAMARAANMTFGSSGSISDAARAMAAADPIPDLPTECEACGEGAVGEMSGPDDDNITVGLMFRCGARVTRGLDPTKLAWIKRCSRAHELLVKMKGEGE